MAMVSLLSTTLPDLLPPRYRSPGLHVSTVITGMCERAGVFERSSESGGEDDRKLSTTWAQLGCAHEWAIVQMLKRRHPGRYRPIGEMIVDGIAMTPDLIDGRPTDDSDWERKLTDEELNVIEEDGIAVDEVKLSWMSAKWVPSDLLHAPTVPLHDIEGGGSFVDGDDKLWRYLLQLKAYCYGARTRVGRLRPVHVNGYWDGNGPQSRVYQFIWTRRELIENWRLILSNAVKYHGHKVPKTK